MIQVVPYKVPNADKVIPKVHICMMLQFTVIGLPNLLGRLALDLSLLQILSLHLDLQGRI